MKWMISQQIKKLPLRLFYFFVGIFFPQDNRIAMRLPEYFPSYRSAFGELMNQLYRILRRDTAYNIQGIIIEPTNFCNLRCKHCTTQRVANDKRGYMSFELFKKILDNNPQITCLMLARNGESFMHPRIFDMIGYARRRNIYVNIFTNGICLNDDKMINKIFESNLNEIIFSMEGIGEFYRYNRGKDYSIIESIIKKMLLERDKRKSPLKIGINTVIIEDSLSEDVKMMWNGVVDYIMIEPLMGKKTVLRRSPCRTLWRNLAITWDGNVLPCCVDMESKLILGNVNNKSLKEIFNDSKARGLRKQHLNKDYPSICKYCSSYYG